MSFFKNGIIIIFHTLLSRIFGLARELCIANFFGTSLYADAINTALRFPNLFRRIVGEGALSSVFVPIYSEKLQQSESKAAKFASEIFTIMFLSLSILCALLIIFMPYVVKLNAPGFILDSKKFEIAVLLSRITMPYMVFISLCALIGGIHNSNGRFGAFAFLPIILNISIITASLLDFSDKENKSILIAISVIIGGIIQLIFMIYTSMSYNIRYGFVFVYKLSSDSIRFFKKMIPAALGSSVTQLNLFLSTAIASISPGAISILSYADRIYQLPLSIIGICFGTLLLPSLSKYYNSKQYKEALTLQTNAVRLSLFLSIACSFGIIVLAHPMIHIIYERGNFLEIDTKKTSDALAIFALGLPAFILNKILIPIFYARHNAKTPFRIAIATMIVNFVANFSLIWHFEHLGIAIGTVISSWFNIAITIYYLKKTGYNIVEKNIWFYIFKVIISALIMAISVHSLFLLNINFLYEETFRTKFFYLVLIVFFGILVYFATALLIKAIYISDIKSLLSKKN